MTKPNKAPKPRALTLRQQLEVQQQYVQSLENQRAKLTGERDAARKDAERRMGHIRTFKTERIQMEKSLADMGGYIARVLEDDAVRELPQEPPQPEAISPEEAYSRGREGRAFHNSRQPESPHRRRGPASMWPMVVYNPSSSMDYEEIMRGSRTMSAAPEEWQDRN